MNFRVSILLSLVFVFSHVADADDSLPTHVSELSSSEKLVDGYGIVFGPLTVASGTQSNKLLWSKRPAEVISLDDQRYSVAVRLAEEDLSSEHRIFTIGITESGRKVLGGVSNTINRTYVSSQSGAKCLGGSREARAIALRSLGKGQLEDLVKLRKERALSEERELHEAVDAKIVQDFSAEERRLGLGYDQPLGIDLPLSEWIYRVEAVRSLAGRD